MNKINYTEKNNVKNLHRVPAPADSFLRQL